MPYAVCDARKIIIIWLWAILMHYGNKFFVSTMCGFLNARNNTEPSNGIHYSNNQT